MSQVAENEIGMLRQLRHPNIVPFLGVERVGAAFVVFSDSLVVGRGSFRWPHRDESRTLFSSFFLVFVVRERHASYVRTDVVSFSTSDGQKSQGRDAFFFCFVDSALDLQRTSIDISSSSP